jgi:alanine racemase
MGNYVRVGIGLYGYHNPYLKLLRSVSLNVQPKNIFKTTKNTKISYIQKKSNDELIGVIDYGYNDLDFSNLHYIYKNNKKYKLLEKNCMNHTHFYADDKINYLSWLSILPTNGIIVYSKDYNYNINWYHLLTSLKGLPKNYIRRRK